MKILAINGSPRCKNSNTDKLLVPFLKGAEKSGAEVEEIYLSQKNIKGCQGCFACWVKTPGKCILKDDMTEEIMDKVNNSDVLILGTPLYAFSMSGQMKIFIDRMIPVMEPFFVEKNGKMSHPRRREKPWKVILISNEGFMEKSHFDLLVSQMNVMASHWGDGEGLDEVILRTSGEVMKYPMLESKMNEIYDALEKAGAEFVLDGKIKTETLNIIEQPLKNISLEQNIEKGNLMWKKAIKEKCFPPKSSILK